MIFNNNRNSIVNPKERNLYYKIFAGYYFNELIKHPNINARFEKFISIKPEMLIYKNNKDKLIINKPGKEKIKEILCIDSEDGFCTTFDNHLLSKQENGEVTEEPGEYCDIGVWTNEKLIAIEAKYTENWDYKNDVKGNIEGLTELVNPEKDVYNPKVNNVLFLLCILDSKYKNALKRKDSQLRKLIESIDASKQKKFDLSKLLRDCQISIGVITWEQVLNSIKEFDDSKLVNDYFSSSIQEMRDQKRIS